MRETLAALIFATVLAAQQRGVFSYPPAPSRPSGGGVVRPGHRGGWIPWGWNGGGGTHVTVVAPGADQPTKPASPLTVSPTYQADKPRPEMREYGSLEPQRPAEANSTVYLIAFRQGGGVESVFTYWIENREFHFVTVRYEVKHAPLDSIDRPLTELLNRKRQVDFRWP